MWGLRLHPATPGWGVRRGCVCLSSGFGCSPPLLAGLLGCACLCACPPRTPPLLAGLCGGGVCVWARVSAAPRHSWLGCWGVCVQVWALRLHPATPGWGVRCGCVCLGSGFGCAPPLLAGVLGCVCAGARALLVPRHSWLGCAPWVCVFGPGFRLRPATPGSGVGVCVCSCACPPCTPPLLAGVCHVGVCFWARVSAAPRHSWLGCWGVCVLVCVLLLYPASPGWGVRLGCVCLGSGFGCAPPLLAGVWAVCVLVCVLRLHPATPDWGARCGCVCLGSGFGCAPPLLAGLCVVGVCARALVLAAPRHSWLGFVVCGLAVAWHLFVCRGLLRVVCALRVCGTRRPSLPGTCPCALVVAGGVPLWRDSQPRVVRRASSGPIALGAAVGFPVAMVPFPTPGACAPGFTGRLRRARGGRRRTGLFVPAAGPAEAGALGSLRVVPARGPAMGLSLAVPSGVGLGLRALRWLACLDPVTDASGFPDRPSFDRGLGSTTSSGDVGRSCGCR